ncbi:isochorismatase family cysteine hydrolase [Amycolatopsis jejuensis]|uniref:isochorismatase family cysteine hydrolase n=1 Tax=Amycolatopsis jejuensis TaxID=330084 RepID=UPI000B0608AA|nr:isochorismatase family cysteine hydrolase [Amycolatopsis jejuensis]
MRLDELDSRSTAVIVVDMQNGFCHPDGTVAKAGPIDPLRAVIPNVTALVQAAHGARMPVFWSIQEHLPQDVSIDRSRLTNPQAELADPPCLQGTWDAELIDEFLDLARNDTRIVKHRASAFYGTGLELQLRMRGIGTVIVCGVSSSYCVDATVRDAYARDLQVIVARDGCASTWPDLHEASMKNHAIFHGTVTDSDTIVKLIDEARG